MRMGGGVKYPVHREGKLWNREVFRCHFGCYAITPQTLASIARKQGESRISLGLRVAGGTVLSGACDTTEARDESFFRVENHRIPTQLRLLRTVANLPRISSHMKAKRSSSRCRQMKESIFFMARSLAAHEPGGS
ncbi:hypothetical protein TGRUB_264260 [Toxoplasma gondii RUB]|uniref:Uncharacterized protein n=11 Tax=Toxoplasma gondii TaxID=5811 RepID=A0A125YPG9_TOXGV|nr:hypothetical protein TGGT1_264260 [Toxoplasma gondii GT1]ESS31762.1 hypothetical protein TGVEG_264260 [Toxoplasma gondii VEG]KFG27795.1 hypothetical protein TGP89_264260 [Toxoplasma gondii p89]KFG29249.1 hypothetical protein TGDOM2_264260 [Toxoplasma gondii GAB2-2007-GAL-DOM2]KFG31630.1 hypothetical protein TGFOU_264260 [Toxoplasma gondii FOU]KFG56656.1 hypothetical protein TGRUB_264260 [Toxoplasma gondii RUB]KFG99335.1 hypothetical protein TGVAND_264260 [Toxoplasma gondii VAND]KFH00654.1